MDQIKRLNLLKKKPWLEPDVARCINNAVRERILRWQAGTLVDALSHKYRGRYWARCARNNSRYCSPNCREGNVVQLALAAKVQWRINQLYRIIDLALRPWDERAKHNPSQRVMDQYDRYLRVHMDHDCGLLTVVDSTRNFEKSWPLKEFPRTSPLTDEEARNIKSYFHRLRDSALKHTAKDPISQLPSEES